MTYNPINQDTVTKEAGVLGFDKKMLTFTLPDSLSSLSGGDASASFNSRGAKIGGSTSTGDQAALLGANQKGQPLNWAGADVIKMEYLFSFPNGSIPPIDDEFIIGVCDETDALDKTVVMGYDAGINAFRVGDNTASPGNIYNSRNYWALLQIEADMRANETHFSVTRGGLELTATVDGTAYRGNVSGIVSYTSNGGGNTGYVQMFGMSVIHR